MPETMPATIASPIKSGSKKIGLALSGGGVRASAYHAGVLLYLAEQNLLEDVVHISSVSGGTLFTGLVFARSALQWPSSDAYVHDVFPYIREILTTKSLQKEMVLRLCYPRNWSFCLSRVKILAQSLEGLWGIKGTLSDLPPNVVWSINGATLETGQRFSFKSCRLGDDALGYADAPNFDLSSAIAVSAALPTAIGPLELDCDAFFWTQDKAGHGKAYVPPYKTIHIYDGGMYDNLGMESLFDVATQSFTKDSGIDFMISSDAGAPYEHSQIGNACNPKRLERLFRLLVDQARALRARSFIHFLQENPQSALYCHLGMMPHKIVQSLRLSDEGLKLNGESLKLDDETRQTLAESTWLSEEEVLYAQRYKTTLHRLSPKAFHIISRHGYESAKMSHLEHGL